MLKRLFGTLVCLLLVAAHLPASEGALVHIFPAGSDEPEEPVRSRYVRPNPPVIEMKRGSGGIFVYGEVLESFEGRWSVNLRFITHPKYQPRGARPVVHVRDPSHLFPAMGIHAGHYLVNGRVKIDDRTVMTFTKDPVTIQEGEIFSLEIQRPTMKATASYNNKGKFAVNQELSTANGMSSIALADLTQGDMLPPRIKLTDAETGAILDVGQMEYG